MRPIITLLLLSTCCSVFSQTVSGALKDSKSKTELPFVNVIIKSDPDHVFISGTVTTEDGRFVLSNVSPGNYILEVSLVGYTHIERPLLVGKLSQYLDLGIIELEE